MNDTLCTAFRALLATLALLAHCTAGAADSSKILRLATNAFVQTWVMGFHGSPFVTYYYQYLDIDMGKQKLAGKR